MIERNSEKIRKALIDFSSEGMDSEKKEREEVLV